MPRCLLLIGALVASGPGPVSAQSMPVQTSEDRQASAENATVDASPVPQPKDAVAPVPPSAPVGPAPAAGAIPAPQPARTVATRFHARMAGREVEVEHVMPIDALRQRRQHVAASWDAAKDVRARAEAERRQRRQNWLDLKRERELQREARRALEAKRAQEAQRAALRAAEERAAEMARFAPLVNEINVLRDELYWARGSFGSSFFAPFATFPAACDRPTRSCSPCPPEPCRATVTTGERVVGVQRLRPAGRLPGVPRPNTAVFQAAGSIRR